MVHKEVYSEMARESKSTLFCLSSKRKNACCFLKRKTTNSVSQINLNARGKSQVGPISTEVNKTHRRCGSLPPFFLRNETTTLNRAENKRQHGKKSQTPAKIELRVIDKVTYRSISLYEFGSFVSLLQAYSFREIIREMKITLMFEFSSDLDVSNQIRFDSRFR